MIDKLLKEVKEGFNIIDIGCRDGINSKWKPIEHLINLHGFDPDKEECNRLTDLKNNFRSVKYHPYAVGGHDGEGVLYKTKSPFCFSLLKPDTEWLKRFSFHEILDLVGEAKIEVSRLDSVDELKKLNADAIKIDSQGLELNILKGATKILDEIIYAETESGFTPNYIDESTQAQVDEFMRSKGFLLFDFIVNRMTHDNIFRDTNKDKAMLLWSESIWLKDYITLHKQNKLVSGENIDRLKAIKVLTFCAIQGCLDYGFELAEIFFELDLINKNELDALGNKDAWELQNGSYQNGSQSKLLNFVLRTLPSSTRKFIGDEALRASNQRHILKK